MKYFFIRILLKIFRLDWLYKLSVEMNSQDNLCSSWPLYVVYDKEYIRVEDGEGDKTVYLDGDCEEHIDFSDDENFEKDIRYAIKRYNDDFEEGDKEIITEEQIKSILEDTWGGRDIMTEKLNYSIVSLKATDRFRESFFTRKAAENYISGISHHLTEPFVFVESAYNNYELRKIIKFISNLSDDSKIKGKQYH